MRKRGGEGGQGTVEWLGLVFLVSLAMAALLALAAGRVPGGGLARAIAARLICAAGLSEACSAPPPLVAAYGPELAARVVDNAPEIDYEDGMSDLPVDFRYCRGGPCAKGSGSGAVRASGTGEPVAAFVHVVDCRDNTRPGFHRPRRYDCSGGRADNVYVQYWLYYGSSSTSPWSELPGSPGAHEDDWEGYQIRIRPSGTDARATSHHGYGYRGGPVNWPTDVGLLHKAAWGESTGHLYVSSGSHAGHVYEPARRSARWTPAAELLLIPIESLAPADRHAAFAIAPPWRKPVFRDPEDQGT
jgi:hypothetical protein